MLVDVLVCVVDAFVPEFAPRGPTAVDIRQQLDKFVTVMVRAEGGSKGTSMRWSIRGTFK